MNVLVYLKNRGNTEPFIYSLDNRLKHLARYSDLHNPQAITQFIADKKASNAYKELLCDAYQIFCQYHKIQWEKPQYTPDEKMPKLPTETQLLKLIAAAGKTLSLKLWLNKETGIRPVELHALIVKNVDLEHSAINPTTAKHGAGRVLKMPQNLTEALRVHVIKNNLKPNDKLFKGNARIYGNNLREMRNRLAERSHDPTLATVKLYDFRHYFGTMTIWKLRDVGLTALDMGHKDWNTTQKYVHLLRIIELNNEDGYAKQQKTSQKPHN